MAEAATVLDTMAQQGERLDDAPFVCLSQPVSDEGAALERAAQALRELGFRQSAERFHRGTKRGSAIALAPWHWLTEAKLELVDGRLRVSMSPELGSLQLATDEDDRFLSAETQYVANAAQPMPVRLKQPKYSRRKSIAQGLWTSAKVVGVPFSGLPVAGVLFWLFGPRVSDAWLFWFFILMAIVALLVGPAVWIVCALGARFIAGGSHAPWARRVRHWTHCTLHLRIEPNKSRCEWFELETVREIEESDDLGIAGRLDRLAAHQDFYGTALWRPRRRRTLFVHASGFSDDVWSVEKRVSLETLRLAWQPHELYLVPPEMPVGQATAAALSGALWMIRREVPSQRGLRPET